MQLRCITVVFAFAALVCASDETAEFKMYLCSDSSVVTKAEGKLVYSYIDGKKTTCLPEYELLALFGQAQFDRDSSAREKEQKVAMAKARASVPVDSLVREIRNGAKDLQGLDLMGVNLENVDLSAANLKSSDLRTARLAGANLSGASLEAAFLKRADLRGANLTGADLRGAYFNEADLRGAQGLSVESLKPVNNLFKARLDTALLSQVKEELPEKLKEPGKCWENNEWAESDDCEPKKVPGMPAP